MNLKTPGFHWYWQANGNIWLIILARVPGQLLPWILTIMPHGLAQWLTFLSDKPLPILNHTKIEIQSLVNQAQLSITQYAAPALFDGGFCAGLFQQVNKQRVAAGRNPLTTLDNALSHLGQGAFQTFLANAKLIEELKLPEKNMQGYMRTMGNACHAAWQARFWGVQRNVMQPEEMQLAALLQNIPELVLWCYGENAMLEIESLSYAKMKNYEQAAKNVLGCGMRELGASLAEKWVLPEMAVEGLCSKHDNFTLASGASLASEMARVVGLNWYGKHASDIVQRIAKYRAKPEAEIERELHINAVEMSDVFIENGYLPPARLLPLIADDGYIDPQFIIHNKAEAAEKDRGEIAAKTVNNLAQPPLEHRKQVVEKQQAGKVETSPPPLRPIEKDKASVVKKTDIEKKKKPALNPQLAKAIKEFQTMVTQAKPTHDLIEYAVKTCLFCGVQRCVFLVKLPNKNILVSRYMEQQSGDIAIQELKIPLDKPHVFSLLMEKTRNLFLNNTNITKYWNHIPDPVKLAIGVKQFFAMSIFANNHAMGLMYADKVKGELSQEEFAQFQGICRLLSKGIVQSAHNKKK